MNRVVYVDTQLQREKFILKKEYNGFGLYEEKCPTGYFVHQSWLITNGDVTLKCDSYMNYCYEEMLDLIDNYIEQGSFGVKGFKRNPWLVHNGGDCVL